VDDDVRRRVVEARVHWPRLALDDDAFVEHVLARVQPDAEVRDAVSRMHLSDLFLACACVRGVLGAAEAFAEHFRADVKRGLVSGSDDDLAQEVMQRLLVAHDDDPPRLASYSGHGPLARWVSVVARRHCLDALRRRGHATEDDAEHAGLSAAYGDPELALMTGDQRDAFRQALQRAAAALSPRERLLLRYHYVHALRLDEIAGIQRVSRTTVGRRIALARKSLVQHARESLRALLGIEDAELDRELAHLRSAIDLTLRRILKD
jgi:RNA polymerase sigma-70 factor (ECF subfamily)